MPIEPYRRLFLLALALGIAGVSLWPLYLSGFVSYPLPSHQHFMIFGMFLSFVSGFLMTALPKMSGAQPASNLETHLAVALIFLSSTLSLSGYEAMAAMFAAAQFAHLFIFIGRRFIVRQKNPPTGFLFVPLGLVWGFAGVVLKEAQTQNIDLGSYGIALVPVALYQAFLLNLIIGLGSRLIPFLTRVEKINPMQAGSGGLFNVALIHASLLNIGFLLEPILSTPVTYYVRALVLLSAAISMFGILKRSAEFSILGVGIRLSVVAMILGMMGMALFPESRLVLLHIIFISGFGLLTFMIATRVVLAHGGHSLNIEKNSGYLGLVIGLMLLATAFRSFYFLNLAAGAWILALFVWFFEIGRRLLKNDSGPSL